MFILIALHSGEDTDSEIRGDAEGDDEHDSLEGHTFLSSDPAAASPTASGHASTSSSSGASSSGVGGAKSRPAAPDAFRRLSFPRDSGCFASNENLKLGEGSTASSGTGSSVAAATADAQRASPAASDRSSHSGVSSHPESGIHGSSSCSTSGGNVRSSAVAIVSGGSSDEDNTMTSPLVGVKQRAADQAAKTRSLRQDRRTINVEELEEQLQADKNLVSAAAGERRLSEQLSSGLRLTAQNRNLSHSETMDLIHARRYEELNQEKPPPLPPPPGSSSSSSNFDALLEKYGKKSTGVRPSFESQFMSARSVFEKAAASVEKGSSPSSIPQPVSKSATTSPVKSPCRKFAETLVNAGSVD